MLRLEVTLFTILFRLPLDNNSTILNSTNFAVKGIFAIQAMAEISHLVGAGNDSDRYRVRALVPVVQIKSDQRTPMPFVAEYGVYSDKYMDVPRTLSWEQSFGIVYVWRPTKRLVATIQYLPTEHARACAFE